MFLMMANNSTNIWRLLTEETGKAPPGGDKWGVWKQRGPSVDDGWQPWQLISVRKMSWIFCSPSSTTRGDQEGDMQSVRTGALSWGCCSMLQCKNTGSWSPLTNACGIDCHILPPETSPDPIGASPCRNTVLPQKWISCHGVMDRKFRVKSWIFSVFFLTITWQNGNDSKDSDGTPLKPLGFPYESRFFSRSHPFLGASHPWVSSCTVAPHSNSQKYRSEVSRKYEQVQFRNI